MARLNYGHLHYFWVVAHEGGFSRAAERLEVAVQTVSGQVRLLEKSLGCELLQPAGRGVALTDAGRVALAEADRIFQIGEQLPTLVKGAAERRVVRFAVGIADAVPKLAVRALLGDALESPELRLVCREGRLDDLTADLALHKLDLVLCDRPVASNPSLRLHSSSLATSPLAWYAPRRIAVAARRGFPGSMATVPLILPTANAAIRPALELWFERMGIRPWIAAEIEDSALLKTLAAGGMGAFAAAQFVDRQIRAQYGVERIAACEGVEEHFYAITAELKVTHPLVTRIVGTSRRLISPGSRSAR